MRPVREHLREAAAVSCRRIDEPGLPFHWHYHPEYELTLITGGTGTRCVGDHVSSFRPGDLLLLGPDVPHSWASSAPVRAAVLHFGAAIRALLDGLPQAGHLTALLDRGQRGLAFPTIPGEITQALAGLPEGAALGHLLALLTVLDRLAGVDAQPLSSTVSAAPNEPSRRRIDDVCRYLLEHAAEPITLSNAAQAACLMSTIA